MLSVDFRRMFTMPLLYIMVGCSLVMPILILVMTTMMDGSVSVNPQTGEKTVIEGFDNVWQIIGTVNEDSEAISESDGSTEEAPMEMGLTTMCNINMLYFLISVLVCVFIAGDFRSGYAKNLFTVRAKKGDYVISKTLAGFVCGAFMLIAYFIGAMLGGAMAGLSFDLHGLNVGNIVMCMLAKIFLMLVFVSIFTLISVAAKHKAWLSICGSLGGGMLLFMMVGMITPLSSTIFNVVLCLAGGAIFAFGLGAASNVVLKKTSLV